MRNRFESTLKELSSIHSANGTATSFYFFPQTPQNKAHREETIRLKDLIRDCRKRLEGEGKREALADLDRISGLADQWARNGGLPKAVFVCSELGLFKTIDLPDVSGNTAIHINSRFHLRPLSEAGAKGGAYIVVPADRVTIRFERYENGTLKEFDRIDSDIPRKTRTDGFWGYDAGHKERHVENWEMRHFKEMADKLKQLCEKDSYDGVLILCRSEIRPEIEPHLHTYVREKLLGFAELDPGMTSDDRVREEIDRRIEEHREAEQQAIVREVVGEAQRNGRGALGLRNVLLALERGEVQTVLIGNGFAAHVTECTNCSHLDTRTAKRCALCSQPVREIPDIADVLVSRALGARIDVAFIDDERFARAGNIGALLRFRADQSTTAKLAG
jgi:peptide subunit release factor 1 (eRF1)